MCIRLSDAEANIHPSNVEHCPDFAQVVQTYGKFTNMAKIHPHGCLKMMIPGLGGRVAFQIDFSPPQKKQAKKKSLSLT